MTEKELINALEYCVNRGNDCKYCPLYKESDCFLIIRTESLNHINRLKTENENYSHNIKKLTEENMRLQKAKYIFVNVDYCADDLEKALEENESLKAKIEQLNNNTFAMAITLSNSAKETRAEAIKEFAERFKNSLKGYGGLYCRTTMNVRIDNLVKEMVGEK